MKKFYIHYLIIYLFLIFIQKKYIKYLVSLLATTFTTIIGTATTWATYYCTRSTACAWTIMAYRATFTWITTTFWAAFTWVIMAYRATFTWI